MMKGGQGLDGEGDENLPRGPRVRGLHLTKKIALKFLGGAGGGRWTIGTLKNKARCDCKDSKALRFSQRNVIRFSRESVIICGFCCIIFE
jgi:hypothetical protein